MLSGSNASDTGCIRRTLMVATGTLIPPSDSLRQFLDADAGRYAVNATSQFIAAIAQGDFNPSFPYRLIHMVLCGLPPAPHWVSAPSRVPSFARSHLRVAR